MNLTANQIVAQDIGEELGAKMCWGHLDLQTGFWHHNPLLQMSREEQLQQNVANGFCTPDGRIPGWMSGPVVKATWA